MPRAQARIPLTRRDVLSFAGVGAAALIGVQIAPRLAHAMAQSVRGAIRTLIGDKTPQEGRVTLKLPEIAEDGSVVPLTIKVDSPMTEADYVKSVHVFAEGNPLPDVASFHFTPRSGLAVASTRIRLAQTQDVLAVAEMSDGSVYMARRTIKVTIGGCGIEFRGRGTQMTQAKPRVRVPKKAKKGEVIQIKTLIPHAMETGLRKDKQGNTIPRKIIDKFVCKYNGEVVFSADWRRAISANPYMAFDTIAAESGTLEFIWTDEDGYVYTATSEINVN